MTALTDAQYQQALAFHQRGQLSQAQVLYDDILRIQPRHAGALHLLGVIAYQTKNHHRAAELIGKAIDIDPGNATYYYNRGNALQELKQFDAAIASYDKAVAIEPNHADAYCNRGNALQELRQFDVALASYDKAIGIKPDYADAYCNRGNALQELRQFDAAVASYDKAIAIKPDYARACYNRGVALQELKQPDAAVASYDKAIAIKPDYAKAYSNRGDALKDLKQLDAAVASYDKAIAIKPDYAEAYSNRGTALQDLKQLDAAVASYDKAIAIKPDYPEVHSNRGIALCELKQYQAALESFGKAFAINPDLELLCWRQLQTRMKICDWSHLDSQLEEVIRQIQRDSKSVITFYFLALATSLPLQLKAAEIWVRAHCPANLALGAIPKRPKRKKIRLGYFSEDFKNHPVAFLTAGLFETHDRDMFEVCAFSYGREARDEMRTRLELGFDKFIDVRDQSDLEIAGLARQMQIDIAIDLAGFTGDSRTGIFTLRAAPLQVNYLGYPGTMGAEYIDYLIADRQLIPEEAHVHYAEKIVYLPSFQANDRKRRISDRVFTRDELGLPESGFVFCCFNNNYKITPGTFDSWMRILKQIDGSVLFLYADNEWAATNLRKEASRRGVDAGRLVFGERLDAPDYLARYRCADLFLDTLPFNGGTTASDALWAGLPVLTCTGEAFASRMAASLLTAIDLPELITSTQEEYEALAVDLATHPERLKALRHKLERNRLTTPLFDTELFTRHIEDAYTQMLDRYDAGLSPKNIDVVKRRVQFNSAS